MFNLCPFLSHKRNKEIVILLHHLTLLQGKTKMFWFKSQTLISIQLFFSIGQYKCVENQYLKLLKWIFIKEWCLGGSTVEFLVSGHELKCKQLMTYTDILLELNFPCPTPCTSLTKFSSFLSVISERHRSWRTGCSSAPKHALGRKLETRPMKGVVRTVYIIFLKFFTFLLYKWSSNHSFLTCTTCCLLQP